MNADVSRDFEAFCREKCHKVQHYHYNSDPFAENMFSNDVVKQKQTISFCGANAHHQNGLAEKAIHNLQEQARTILLHIQSRWPHVIHTSLWSYAMKTAYYVSNILPSPGSIQSQVENFAEVTVVYSSIIHTHLAAQVLLYIHY